MTQQVENSGVYNFKQSPLRTQLDQIERDQLDKGTLTYDNPLRYRGYLIFHSDHGYGGKYEFAHKEYDGPGDNRLGSAQTIEECVVEINEQIESSIEDAIIRGAKFVRVDNRREEIELSDFIEDNTDDGMFLDDSEYNRLNALQVGEQCQVMSPMGQKKMVRRTR